MLIFCNNLRASFTIQVYIQVFISTRIRVVLIETKVMINESLIIFYQV